MRLDGGHPALELVNTIYGQVGGPVEHDVLSTPEDLVTLGRRLGLAGPGTPADAAALAGARALRDALDPVLRALLDGSPVPAGPREAVEAAAEGDEVLGGRQDVVLDRPADLPVDRVHELEGGMAAVEAHGRGRRRSDHSCFHHKRV